MPDDAPPTGTVQEAVAAAISAKLASGWLRGWQFPVDVGDLCYIVHIELNESYAAEVKNRRKDGTYRAKNRKHKKGAVRNG